MTNADPPSADFLQVSVVIPTYNRNDLLVTCLNSCLDQRKSFDVPYEIVVVDNSANGGARQVVEGYADSEIPVRMIHQPAPGISNARNAGLAAANAPYVAWIDDDEYASPTWLRDLWTTANERKVDVVFGSVEPRFDREVSPEIAKFFHKNASPSNHKGEKHYSTSNCLMNKEIARGMSEPFSLDRNFTGGEDHLFFMEAKKGNATFAWDVNSVVFETIPGERARWSYLMMRSFRKHQMMVQNFFDVRPKNWGMIVRCMVVGGGQFVAYGAYGSVLWLARSRRAAPVFNRCLVGLAKLIWFRPFQAEHYGRSG